MCKKGNWWRSTVARQQDNMNPIEIFNHSMPLKVEKVLKKKMKNKKVWSEEMNAHEEMKYTEHNWREWKFTTKWMDQTMQLQTLWISTSKQLHKIWGWKRQGGEGLVRVCGESFITLRRISKQKNKIRDCHWSLSTFELKWNMEAVGKRTNV